MYRIKQLLGGSLTLRDYDGQVVEAMAMVRALNIVRRKVFRRASVLPKYAFSYRYTRTKYDLFNEAVFV